MANNQGKQLEEKAILITQDLDDNDD